MSVSRCFAAGGADAAGLWNNVRVDSRAAMVVLGLSGSPSWAEIRVAYRSAIRHAHPDAGGDPTLAAEVNRAFETLRAATSDGSVPLQEPQRAPVARHAPATPREVLDHDDPVDVLLRLADAAHEIGEVVFVDPTSGLMEVVVGEPPGVGQLAVHVELDNADHDGVPVAFTLDRLGIAPAPPIHEVVSELMGRYRRRTERPS
ncbi:MAG: hypothetical protein ACPHDT_08970 [Acidimicrobiales bacterium]